MKRIYILLSRTETTPSRLIHFFAGGTYTHVSIATEAGTDKFFSFARRSMRNILKAGLISEDVHEKTFALYPDSPCAIYELQISEESYLAIEELIRFYWNNYKKCKYNFIGAFAIFFGIKLKLRYRMTCSQFVALLLDRSKAASLPKEPSLMLPNDFLKLDSLTLIYKGPIKDCHFPKALVSQQN